MWGYDFGEALSLTEALWLSSVLIAEYRCTMTVLFVMAVESRKSKLQL